MKDKIEFSLIDALAFLKSGARNVFISTLVSVLAGAAYYLGGAKIYEATATIQLDSNSREMIDASMLLEKIKLPKYFSEMTIKACDSNTEPNYGLMPHVKFERNKHAPLITITKQAATAEMALSCLNLATLEILKQQEKNTNQQQLLLNQEEFIALKKFATEANKSMKSVLNKDNMSATLALNKDLLNQTKFWEALGKFVEHPLYIPASLVEPIYVFEVSKIKQFASALDFLLFLGSFFGLLITLVMRELPDILRQMRLAGGDNVES